MHKPPFISLVLPASFSPWPYFLIVTPVVPFPISHLTMRCPPPLGRKLSSQNSLRTTGSRPPTRTLSTDGIHEYPLPSSSIPPPRPPPPNVPGESLYLPHSDPQPEIPESQYSGWTEPTFTSPHPTFLDALHCYPELRAMFSSCSTHYGIHGDDDEVHETATPTYIPQVPNYAVPPRRDEKKPGRPDASRNAKEGLKLQRRMSEVLMKKEERQREKKMQDKTQKLEEQVLSPPPSLAGAYQIYQWKWDTLRNLDQNVHCRFRDLPWPVLFRLGDPAQLTSKAVVKFLLHDSRMEDLKVDWNDWNAMRKSLLKEQVLWHPDKFNTIVDHWVRASDREKAKRAGMKVAQFLNTYLGMSSTWDLYWA